MNAIKYPRTFHIPFTGCAAADDKVLDGASHFEGVDVVVTEKMDGENCSMMREKVYARSLDSRFHESQAWVRNLHAQIAHDIPEDWRLCDENLYAQHSLVYQDLRSYFYLFSIWTDKNVCLSWDETMEWAELFGLEVPKVLYRGIWEEATIKKLAKTLDTEKHEGFVVRTAGGFHYDDFRHNVAKWVRPDHVQEGSTHWKHQTVKPNGLLQQ